MVEYPGQTRGRNLRNRWMRLLRMIFPNASVRIIYMYTTVLGIGQPPPSAPHQQSVLFKPKFMNRGAMNDDRPKYYPHQEKLQVSNSIDRCFPLSSQGTKPSSLRMNESDQYDYPSFKLWGVIRMFFVLPAGSSCLFLVQLRNKPKYWRLFRSFSFSYFLKFVGCLIKMNNKRDTCDLYVCDFWIHLASSNKISLDNLCWTTTGTLTY